MTDTVLRSLYLTVGVQTKAAMAALRGIRVEMDSTTRSARAMLKSLSAVGGSAAAGSSMRPIRDMSKGVASDMARANREAKSMVALLSRPINVRVAGGGGMAGGAGPYAVGGGRGPGAGFMGRAIERSLAVTSFYLAGRAVENLAASDYRATRAGSITGTSAAQQRAIRDDLMRRYFMRSEAASRLGLSTAQIGVTGQAARDLAGSSAAFSRVEEGVAPEDAAKAVYRLAVATKAPQSQYRGIMSAVLRAGDISPAGPEEVFDMMRGLQSAFTIGRFTAAEGIGLASALAGIDPNARESARGSLIRMFADPKISALAQAMARRGGLASPGTATGGQVIGAIGSHLASISPEARLGALQQLTNVRDRKFLTDLANSISEFAVNSTEASAQIANGGQYLDQQMADYNDSTKGRIDQLRSSLDALGHTVLNVVGPALSGTLAVASGALGRLAGNPMLTGASLAGAGLLLGRRTAVGRLALGAIGASGSRFLAIRSASAGMGMPSSFTRAASFYHSAFGSRIGGAASRAMMGQGGGRFLAGSLRAVGGGLGTTLGELGMGRLLAGRLSPLAATPIGLGAAALGMLQPVFGGLADGARELGRVGGVAGVAANSLSILFRVLEGGGRAVNFVFDSIGKAISGFFDLPIVSHIVDFANWAAGGVSDILSGSSLASPRPAVSNTFNVRVGSSAQFQAIVERAAARGVSGHVVSSYRPGV